MPKIKVDMKTFSHIFLIVVRFFSSVREIVQIMCVK